MKRIIALLLVFVLLLAGCGKQEPVVETEPSQETTPATEATEPTTEATEAPTEEATETPAIIRHPLTGEVLDALFTGHVTAVSINNIKACLPQYGISQADIIYEFQVESDITRLLALFTDFSDIEKLGPVRSARTQFNAIAYSFQAPLIHCGAGKPARYGYMDYNVTQIKDWQHIDANAMSGFFYRDQDRIKSGMAYEHTLFTTGENALKALESKGYNKVNEDGLDFGLLFAETPAIQGEAANTVTVTFKGGKTSIFVYNAETGLYAASQYGQDHIDGSTKEALTYRNVINLYTEQTTPKPGSSSPYYELVGSGTGHMAVDGKIVPILWSHPSYEEPFSYTLEDGTPLELGVGRTYIAVSGGKEVTYK